MLFFLLGSGVVPVRLVGGELCQSESVQEGPSEQSREAVQCQGQGESQPLRPLASAQPSWGKGGWHTERGRLQI